MLNNPPQTCTAASDKRTLPFRDHSSHSQPPVKCTDVVYYFFKHEGLVKLDILISYNNWHHALFLTLEIPSPKGFQTCTCLGQQEQGGDAHSESIRHLGEPCFPIPFPQIPKLFGFSIAYCVLYHSWLSKLNPEKEFKTNLCLLVQYVSKQRKRSRTTSEWVHRPSFPGVPASQYSIYINYRNFIYIFLWSQLDKYLPIYNI